MNMKYALLTAAIMLGCLIDPAFTTAGGKGYGDSCTMIASGVQFFQSLAGGKDNYIDACDLDKGLVCKYNVCTCLPGYYYKSAWYNHIFGGGHCASENGDKKYAFGKASGLMPAVQVLFAGLVAYALALFH